MKKLTWKILASLISFSTGYSVLNPAPPKICDKENWICCFITGWQQAGPLRKKTKTTTLMLMWEVYETGFFGSVRYNVIIRFKCTLMAFSVIRCCDVILALKCALQPRCIHPKLYDWTFLIRKTSMDMSKKFVLLAVKIDINIFLLEMFQIVFVVTEMGNLKRF